MAINSGNFSKALWEGVNSWYGNAYGEHNTEYTEIFETRSSRKAFEEIMGQSLFGLAPVKPEGSAVAYQTANQGHLSRFTNIEYALGFVITRNMVKDDLYDVAGKMRARSLARSIQQTRETVGANVLNRAFNASYLGGDGLELCSGLHTNVAGGTWANELATAADLSEASLEQACIDIGKWEDDAGLKIAAQAKKLIIPVDLQFEADRIINSSGRVATADNDKNSIMGKFEIAVNHYLTDTDAFFLKTDVDNGLIHFEREADRFAEDNEFDTDNMKYKAVSRYSMGWADPRGIFGSPGA